MSDARAPAPTLASFCAGPWISEACERVRTRCKSRHRAPGSLWTSGASERMRMWVARGDHAHQWPHRVQIPKPRGGTREIVVYPPEEQALHTALGACLSSWLEAGFSDASFAFRPGRGVGRALARAEVLAREGGWVAEVDVLDCFGSLRHADVLGVLQDAGLIDPPLLLLLRRCMGTGATWSEVGLAQGSALSPVLCNLALDPVDRELASWPGYLRYADDLVCFTASHPDAASAFAAMCAALQRRDLRVHPDKSRVSELGAAWSWLGSSLGVDGRFRRPRSRLVRQGRRGAS